MSGRPLEVPVHTWPLLQADMVEGLQRCLALWMVVVALDQRRWEQLQGQIGGLGGHHGWQRHDDGRQRQWQLLQGWWGEHRHGMTAKILSRILVVAVVVVVLEEEEEDEVVDGQSVGVVDGLGGASARRGALWRQRL